MGYKQYICRPLNKDYDGPRGNTIYRNERKKFYRVEFGRKLKNIKNIVWHQDWDKQREDYWKRPRLGNLLPANQDWSRI